MLVAALVVLVGACSGGDADADADAAPTSTVAMPEGVTLVSAEQGQALLESGEDVTVIDVRTPEEYAGGYVPGAVNIDLQGADFERRIGELDPDATYLVYCRSGNRSAVAAEIMSEVGFGDVRDMGGIIEWESAGGEVVLPAQG